METDTTAARDANDMDTSLIASPERTTVSLSRDLQRIQTKHALLEVLQNSGLPEQAWGRLLHDMNRDIGREIGRPVGFADPFVSDLRTPRRKAAVDDTDDAAWWCTACSVCCTSMSCPVDPTHALAPIVDSNATAEVTAARGPPPLQPLQRRCPDDEDDDNWYYTDSPWHPRSVVNLCSPVAETAAPCSSSVAVSWAQLGGSNMGFCDSLSPVVDLTHNDSNGRVSPRQVLSPPLHFVDDDDSVGAQAPSLAGPVDAASL